MCTKILLEQLEKLPWNGKDALENQEWRLSFKVAPWTKGLAVVLKLQALQVPADPYWAGFMYRDGLKKNIVLRQGQDPKLVKNMLQLWVERLPGSRAQWLDRKISKDTLVGLNVRRFVSAVMSRYRDVEEVVHDRAMDNLRAAVRRAQESGLSEEDLKIAWDEGLFAKLMTS